MPIVNLTSSCDKNDFIYLKIEKKMAHILLPTFTLQYFYAKEEAKIERPLKEYEKKAMEGINDVFYKRD